MKITHKINAIATIGVLGLFGVGFLLLGLSYIGVSTEDDIANGILLLASVLLMPLGILQVVLAITMYTHHSYTLDRTTVKHLQYYGRGVLGFVFVTAIGISLWNGDPRGILGSAIAFVLSFLYIVPFILALYFLYITRSGVRAVAPEED